VSTSSAEHLRPRPLPLSRLDTGVWDPAATATPAPLTSLIGREREIGLTQRMLQQPDLRLVTLTGPGGVGKTRLALAVAAKLAEDFPDGIVYVWLAPIADAGLVLPALARALGVPDGGAAPLLGRVQAILQSKELLLVLDNFEQVLPATGQVAEILTAAPAVKALVTSRSLLRVSGEHSFPVLPLSLPKPGQGYGSPLPCQLAEIEGADAVRLFVTRARAVDPGFHLTDANASIVTEICRRLDGLPLAIELAAARANVLTPADLLARLERRLPLLTGGPSDQPERLRTMRGAIRWSYELLSPEEQWFFERLAVCADGFSVQAAEQIAGARPGDADNNLCCSTGDDWQQVGDNQTPSPLELLTSLVDKNLLRRDERVGGNAGFVMLETIREFALERLHVRGGAPKARDAHAAHYLAFAERWAPDHFRDHDLEPRLAAVEAEYDNVRVALAHLLQSNGEAAVRLAGLLPSFWYLRSRVGEGRDWLERVISGSGVAAPREQAAALTGLGLLNIFLADLATAKTVLARALALAEMADDAAGIGFARLGQSIVAVHECNFAAAASLGNESANRYASIGDEGHAMSGRIIEARAAQYTGDLDRAGGIYRLLLTHAPDLPYPRSLIEQSLAMIANARGDHQRALAHAVGALGPQLKFGELWGFSACLDTVAAAQCALGQADRAVRLFAAAATARMANGTPMIPADQPWYEHAVAAAESMLGEATFEAAWEAGRALSPTEAFHEVLADIADDTATLDRAGVPRRFKTQNTPVSAWLSTREVEVLRLVAEGWADKEIASALAISRHTASKHVAAIRAKLHAPSRTGAVAAARDAGVL
jgi:predicted ATPase/DNA-binding CsgD family transcriptional regulator